MHKVGSLLKRIWPVHSQSCYRKDLEPYLLSSRTLLTAGYCVYDCRGPFHQKIASPKGKLDERDETTRCVPFCSCGLIHHHLGRCRHFQSAQCFLPTLAGPAQGALTLSPSHGNSDFHKALTKKNHTELQ